MREEVKEIVKMLLELKPCDMKKLENYLIHSLAERETAVD